MGRLWAPSLVGAVGRRAAVDAAGLLASAIADPNPVVVVECKTLYFRNEDVPDEIVAAVRSLR